MLRTFTNVVLLSCVLIGFVPSISAQQRPAPSPSRYSYTLKVDSDSLPKGVTVRESREGGPPRWFISNSTETPLIIHERFQNGTLASGTKLVSGIVYQYFPNGVPMEGKTHLKGWQAPFGDIKEALLYLEKEPATIYDGHKPGLSKELPQAEEVSIPAKFDDKPTAIKAVIEYHLNDAYDEFYRSK